MNELITLNQKEKKEIIDKFRREQAELEKFYEEIVRNLKLNRERKKKKD